MGLSIPVLKQVLLGFLSVGGKTAAILPEVKLDLVLTLHCIAIIPLNLLCKLKPCAAAPHPTQEPCAGSTAAGATFLLPPV